MRTLHPSLTLLCLCLGSLYTPAWSQDGKRNLVVQAQAPGQSTHQRVALVIGNNSYADAPLSNPVNDARAMAKALEGAGFQVILKLNANHRDMLGAVRDFGSRLRQGGSGLFYFAGHGMQIKGRNYLIPVGADIQREDEVAYQAMDAQSVLDKMDSAGNGTNLMILDACRNNPFARSFRSATLGLAQMEAPVGTLVAFATSPGSVSSDGSGQHGLYTEHLLRLMRQPGLKVEDIFKQVRVAVRKESQGKQVPWESTSLEGDFYFVEPLPVAAPSLPPAPSPTKLAPDALEQAFWEAVRDSAVMADLQAYLNRFPSGQHAELARSRLATLGRVAEPATSTPPAATRPSSTATVTLPDATPRLAVGQLQEGLFPQAPMPSVTPHTAGVQSIPDASPRLSVGLDLPATRPPPARPPAVSTPRGYSVGDRWSFQVVDKWRGEVVRNYSTQVKQVRADGSWVTGGGTLMDPWAQVLEVPGSEGQGRTTYTPAQPRWWEPMQTGERRRFTYRIEVENADGVPTVRQVVADAVVKGREKIRVPAGEFEAWRVQFDSEVDSQRGRQRWANRWQHTYWYVPELRYFAAVDVEVRNDRNALERRDREELVSYEQRQGALALR